MNTQWIIVVVVIVIFGFVLATTNSPTTTGENYTVEWRDIDCNQFYNGGGVADGLAAVVRCSMERSSNVNK